MEAGHVYQLNKRYYDTPGVPESYARRTMLQHAERVILDYLENVIRDKPILEIGVGQGRTTPYLRALSDRYVGIDYSENMLKPCKRRFADASLLLCDGRRLSFETESFSCVYFCWNAIDDVDHRDRIAMLGEIYRVLKRGGVFFFSAHNLDSKLRSAFRFRGFVSASHPAELIAANGRRIIRYAAGIRNRLRMRRFERHEDGYSILNDQAHDYGLLTYYVRKQKQVEQLMKAGYSSVEIVTMDGSFISREERCEDDWIYYIARKAN